MKKNEKIPLIYILGMPIIFIIANSISTVHIELLGSTLYFSVLLYPLIFLISGLIIRKSDYKKAMAIVGLSLISASLEGVFEWIAFDTMNAYVMIYAFMSFLICQLIFIYTYDFLIKINRDTYLPVLILLAIVSSIDNAFFGTIIEGKFITISILVRIIYVVAIPVVLAKNSSKKIKK